MKTPQVIGLVVAAVAATAAIQEVRISRMKRELAARPAVSHGTPAAGPEAGAGLSAPAAAADPAVVTKRDRPADADAPATGAEDDSMVRGVRKMWDNPAGKAMMNQGAKYAVAMMYDDFIKSLDLSAEEGDYFKGLLGGEIALQQELGMKMMGATPGERAELAEQLEAKRKETEEAVRRFLNSDEDYQAFSTYKERAPERQQLEGLRAVMRANGAELDPDAEAKLVEAMYDARIDSGAPDYSGPNAFAELSKGDVEKTFEENWRKQDERLMEAASGFLDEDQLGAMREFRGQMKDMQMMGLKMVRKMMGGDEAEE